jgi:hypothetical protein
MFTIGNVGLGQSAGGWVEGRAHAILGSETLHVKGATLDTVVWTSDILDARNFALNPARWNAKLRETGSSYIEEIWRNLETAYMECFGHKIDILRHDVDFSYTLVTGYNQERIVGRKEHLKNVGSYISVLNDSLGAEISNTRDKRSASFEKHTRNCTGRRFGLLASGKFALLPGFAKPKDSCVIFGGMATPFVLRKRTAQVPPGSVLHHLVGEAYMYGAMRGELAEKLSTEQVDFWLV